MSAEVTLAIPPAKTPPRSPDEVLAAAFGACCEGDFSERIEAEGCVVTEKEFGGAIVKNAVFRQVRFSHVGFSGARFEGCMFFECSLEGVSLKNASLTETSFDRCLMVGCNAQGATLEKVTITDSSIEATRLDQAVVRMSAWDGVGINACDLSRATFEDCEWSRVVGKRVLAASAVWVRPAWRGVELRDADLAGGQFRGGVIQDLEMRGCDLVKSVWANCEMIGVAMDACAGQGMEIEGGRLSFWMVKNGSMTGSSVRRGDLEDVEMVGVDLSNATLDRIRGTRMFICGIGADNFKMKGTEMSNSVIARSKFSEGAFDRCDFAGTRAVSAVGFPIQNEAEADPTDLAKKDLRRAVVEHILWLKGVDGGQRLRVVGADLLGANFRGMDLRLAVFENCVLRGADFAWANLEGADLIGCDLSEAVMFCARLQGAVGDRTDDASETPAPLGDND